LSKPISKLEKQVFKINDKYDVVYLSGKHVLRKTLEDGAFEFKSIKPDVKIDLEKLKNGEYTIDDLLQLKNDCLGKHGDYNVYVKTGKYGNYIQWGDNKTSIKNITKDLNTLTLDDVMGHIYSIQGGCEEKEELEDTEETKNCEKEYVGVVKKVKKDNITPDNIGPIMLSQIPGISSVTANAIFEKYKTISDLIKEVELNNNCLKDLSTINNKGQSRKISKASIANIVKFLLKK
jgi:hypothetical protein